MAEGKMLNVTVRCKAVHGLEEARQALAKEAQDAGFALWVVAEEPAGMRLPDGVAVATYARVRRAKRLERDGMAGAMDGFRVRGGVLVLEPADPGTPEHDGMCAVMLANMGEDTMVLVRQDPPAPEVIAAVETGDEYPTMAAAARAVGKTPQGLRKAVVHGSLCGGMHWERRPSRKQADVPS